MITLLDGQGKPADTSATIWVILSDDGKQVLSDPVHGGPWWSYHIKDAKDIQLIAKKDFGEKVHIRKLAEGIKILAERRYGISLKSPYTYHNIIKQIKDKLITGELKNDNLLKLSGAERLAAKAGKNQHAASRNPNKRTTLNPNGSGSSALDGEKNSSDTD
jgi:hypothetical protein